MYEYLKSVFFNYRSASQHNSTGNRFNNTVVGRKLPSSVLTNDTLSNHGHRSHNISQHSICAVTSHPDKTRENVFPAEQSLPSAIDRIGESLLTQRHAEQMQSGSHVNLRAAHAHTPHDIRASMTSVFRSVSSTGIHPYGGGLLAPVSCPPNIAVPPSVLQYPMAMYPPTPALTSSSSSSDVKQLTLAQYHGVSPHAAFPNEWAKYKSPLINRNYLELAMLVCNTFRGKLFPCPHCRYVTDRRNNLKRHISTMHQACDKVLECCGVTFNTKASLREHIMIFHHNGYSCPYCGRRFCRKALLKRHLSVHSGQKDYSCPHCDYATSHKSNLERHKRIHERLKSFDDNSIIDVENIHDNGSDSEYLPEPEVEIDGDDIMSECDDELNVTDDTDLPVFSTVTSRPENDIHEDDSCKESNTYALNLCTTSH